MEAPEALHLPIASFAPFCDNPATNMKNLSKKILRRARRFIYAKGPRLWSRAPSLIGPLLAQSDPIVALLFGLHRSRSEVRFVQVGSNDADIGDPLRLFLHTGTWAGLMIEPVDYVFKRLMNNHAHNPRISFENVAISSVPVDREFHYLGQSNDSLPAWYDQLGSFSLETLLKHERHIPDIRKRLKSIIVTAVTFQDVCDRNCIHHIDLIHIDTEGSDYEILKSIDFQAYQPDVVIYEHKHLAVTKRQEARCMLLECGYSSVELRDDTICVRRSALNGSRELSQAWEWIADQGMP
jgi:FkbM family methyltransferase